MTAEMLFAVVVLVGFFAAGLCRLSYLVGKLDGFREANRICEDAHNERSE